MTALDQAFVKAFSRQNTVPLASSTRAVAPKNEKRKTTQEKPSEEHVAGGSRAVGGARASALKVQELETSPKSPISSPRPSLSSPQSPISNPSLTRGVWAALEQTPQAVVGPPKPDEENRALQESVVGGQSSLFGGQWSVDTGQWSTESEPWTLGTEPCRRSSEPAIPESVVAAVEVLRQRSNLPPAQSASTPESPPSSYSPAPSAISLPSMRQEFQPAWQVDQFSWPRLCRRLISHAADELDRLADALLAANQQGQKVLAIGSCQRGEGATTLLLCAARRLAERGIKPVLVDADMGRPRLAKRLGVQPQFGWDETAEEEGRWLDQAIVEATGNNLALLPLREPPDECGRPVGDPSRLAACLKALRDHYDMVLVDVGPLGDAGETRQDAASTGLEWAKGAIDAVVLVHNHRITSQEQQVEFEGQLSAAGITVAGIVENFAGEE